MEVRYLIVCTSEFEEGEYVHGWYKTKAEAKVDFNCLKTERNINSVDLYKVEPVAVSTKGR
jgi:hypothetical protein